MPALAHHAPASSRDKGLKIYVWDEVSTGIALPPPPIDLGMDDAWHYDRGAFFGVHSPTLNSYLWIDRERGEALYWTRDLREVPLAERGSPLLHIWAAWLAPRGVHVVHAAALSGLRGAALLLGAGGTGKSSTALAAFQSSLQYLADDYCLLQPQPDPTIHSLYSSGKVFCEDRAFYPFLEPAVAGENGVKTVYQFMPSQKEHLCANAPLLALMAVTRTGASTTTLTRISSMQAVQKVAPNTLLQIRVGIDPGQTLKALAFVARKVDCFELNLGTDRFEVLTALEQSLS